MILCAKLVVAEKNRNLSACQNKNEKDNQGESKHIVKLIHPQARHNEEKFNVSGGEWDDASKCHSKFGIQQKGSGRDGPCNSRSYSWESNNVFLVSKVSTQEDKGNTDATPHRCQNKDIQEWDGTR